ncbi:hypothetical protein D3C81_1081390 [compost metagenome]
MHALPGQLAHGRDHVDVLRLDQVRGAELPRQFQLAVEHVDGDDPPGPGQRRAVDRRQADAAAADHGNRLAGRHLGGIDHRAGAGGDGAADQRGAVQWHVAPDCHAGVFVHEHLLGEGRQVGELRHRLVLVRQTRLIALGPAGVGGLAQRQVPGQAVLAVPAVDRQAGHHVVARLDRTHLRAHLLDHAGGLMAQHHRRRVRKHAVDEMEVGMADADGAGANQHLARAGLGDGDVLNTEGLAGTMEYRSFHG